MRSRIAASTSPFVASSTISRSGSSSLALVVTELMLLAPLDSRRYTDCVKELRRAQCIPVDRVHATTLGHSRYGSDSPVRTRILVGRGRHRNRDKPLIDLRAWLGHLVDVKSDSLEVVCLLIVPY